MQASLTSLLQTGKKTSPEGEEGIEGAPVTEGAEVPASEDGLSPNASKVQEFADTLAAEIEAEGLAESDDGKDTEDGDNND